MIIKKKGIIFKDLSRILWEPNIFRTLINRRASIQEIQSSEAILTIEARGFIFRSAIAFHSRTKIDRFEEAK